MSLVHLSPSPIADDGKGIGRSIDIDENETSRPPPSQIDGIIRDRIERRETSTDPLSFNRVSLDVAGGRGRGRTESIIFVWTVSDESGEADTGESDCKVKKLSAPSKILLETLGEATEVPCSSTFR